MELSIVSTMYRSEPYLAEFVRRVGQAAESLTRDYEIVLVNDGSPDRSRELALALQRDDPRIVVVDLSRNFGHHKAIMTGLAHAQGDRVFLIDSDLEEEPELLVEFWNELAQHPALDVVYGVQRRRKGGLFERLSGYLYFTVANWLSDVKIPRNFLTVRLMTRRYVESLVRFEERDFVFSALTELAGYEGAPIVVTKLDKGGSTYSLLMKFRVLVNHITSTSVRPLWIVFQIGLVITLLTGVLIVRLLYVYFTRNITPGFTSLALSIWFLGGMQLMAIGVVGVYLAKVYTQVKGRPYTIVRQVYRARTADS
ncbi:MAG TPA: glycosyltransferase family 2 protein [bacterium]|nr:glycosyltransferase family 2 protein [bacterium]